MFPLFVAIVKFCSTKHLCSKFLLYNRIFFPILYSLDLKALAIGGKIIKISSLTIGSLHTLRMFPLNSLQFPWSLTCTKIGLSTMSEDGHENVYFTNLTFFGLILLLCQQLI